MGQKVIIEKGKPMKNGETRINFVLFDPFNKRSKDHVMKLFEIPIMEQIRVGELKVLLSEKKN